MLIKVLGPGCASCQKLDKLVEEVVKDLEGDVKVEHVTDMAEILSFGVMGLPALVVDDKVVLAGKVPSKAALLQLLKQG